MGSGYKLAYLPKLNLPVVRIPGSLPSPISSPPNSSPFAFCAFFAFYTVPIFSALIKIVSMESAYRTSIDEEDGPFPCHSCIEIRPIFMLLNGSL